MFVSMNLQVTSKNINNDMLEYDVYDSNHNYYITERFELCVLSQIKYISNHVDPLHVINHVVMHLLQIQETEEQLFIVQNVNIEDKTWDKLNNKRINLHTYLKGQNTMNNLNQITGKANELLSLIDNQLKQTFSTLKLENE